jgi:ADP-ribose pyrophosphatase
VKTWKTLDKKLMLNMGKFLSIESHTVELPDGQVIADWAWVIAPDYVNVAILTEDNKFLCLRQTKYGIDGTSLATVSGILEPDEAPLETAKRELLEEAGYEAKDWISFGMYTADGSRGVAKAYPFLALNAWKVKEPQLDAELEEQELVYLDRLEAQAALLNGEFKVFGWAMVMTLSLLYLSQQTSNRTK